MVAQPTIDKAVMQMWHSQVPITHGSHSHPPVTRTCRQAAIAAARHDNGGCCFTFAITVSYFRHKQFQKSALPHYFLFLLSSRTCCCCHVLHIASPAQHSRCCPFLGVFGIQAQNQAFVVLSQCFPSSSGACFIARICSYGCCYTDLQVVHDGEDATPLPPMLPTMAWRLFWAAMGFRAGSGLGFQVTGLLCAPTHSRGLGPRRLFTSRHTVGLGVRFDHDFVTAPCAALALGKDL